MYIFSFKSKFYLVVYSKEMSSFLQSLVLGSAAALSVVLVYFNVQKPFPDDVTATEPVPIESIPLVPSVPVQQTAAGKRKRHSVVPESSDSSSSSSDDDDSDTSSHHSDDDSDHHSDSDTAPEEEQSEKQSEEQSRRQKQTVGKSKKMHSYFSDSDDIML
jgi:hypothetical protein